MRNLGRLVSVTAAVLVAAASGYVMHRQATVTPDATGLAGSTFTPTDAATATPVLAALPSRTIPADAFAPRETLATACANAVLTAEPAPAAMLALHLSAPCLPNARVELSQGALSFAVLTDAEGLYAGQMPALTREARVVALMPDGAQVAASAQVGGLGAYTRVLLLAGAAHALHLMAFENGAAFGAPGHRSARAPGTPSQGPGGFLTPLGDAAASPPLLAEVYTAPASLGDTLIAVLADVTAATCGTDLGGAMLRMGAPEPLAFTIAMPACDGIESAVLLPLPEVPLALALADHR